MADVVTAQIAIYRAAKLDRNGESQEKCEVIQKLEDHLAEPKTLTFFLELIADSDEYDMARIDALKILQVWEPPTDQLRNRVGRSLAGILAIEPNVSVQQWAAIAAENFIDVPEVFTAASLLLADHEANLDVRHNCLAALRRFGPSDQVRAVLNSLTTDSNFGVSVRRILNEWNRPSEPPTT